MAYLMRLHAGKSHKTLKARDRGDRFLCGGVLRRTPGIQISHTKTNDWHTGPAGSPIRASNPVLRYCSTTPPAISHRD